MRIFIFTLLFTFTIFLNSAQSSSDRASLKEKNPRFQRYPRRVLIYRHKKAYGLLVDRTIYPFGTFLFQASTQQPRFPQGEFLLQTGDVLTRNNIPIGTVEDQAIYEGHPSGISESGKPVKKLINPVSADIVKRNGRSVAVYENGFHAFLQPR